MIICHPSALCHNVAKQAYDAGYHVADHKGRLVWKIGRNERQRKVAQDMFECHEESRKLNNDK